MWLKNILRHLFSFLNGLFRKSHLEVFDFDEANFPDRISRTDILRFLETHSSENLNLSHKNLADIDLSGLDLSRASFNMCIFQSANLSHCILKDVEFHQSIFRKVDLSRSLMARADFSGAYFRACNLTNSSLYRAILDRADFFDSDLTNANLARASLIEVRRLTAASLGHKLVQDSPQKYEEYVRWISDLDDKNVNIDDRVDRWLRDRLVHGEIIYRALKVSFANDGHYADSSWAYIRERQMRRQQHNLFLAKHIFSSEYPINGRFKPLRRLVFYLKHFWLWLMDWLAEISCGYGEKPFLTILWAAGTLIVFPFIYWASGGVSGPQSLLDYFNYSLAAFTTLGFEQFTAETPLAQTLTSIEAILGISILALLMFVLGNRISRS